MVMFEWFEFGIGATVSVSMLYPRPAKSPEILESTELSFSTKTEITLLTSAITHLPLF
jgi:hypothetical protein